MPSVSSSKDRPNTAWPVGSRFDLVDAWFRNPIEVKRIAVATNIHHVVGEDAIGIRYYAHTDRIVSGARFEKRPISLDFDDILGIEDKQKVKEFEDLI